MSHYKSNVRDQVFNLFEVFGLEKALGQGSYSDVDADTAREMLQEMSRLAEGPVAASFVEGDRNPPVFDPETHSVKLPEAFKKSVHAVTEAGWDKVGIEEELGGTPVPRALVWALAEHVLGANPAVWMYAGGAGFSSIFYKLATDEQKKWAILAAERGWGSTMVLTEPDAGSDVGAGRTKAVKQDDGSWHIDGVKRFITSADSDDMFENIFHLVLARPPEGAGPGTKGLSLFFVPKFHFDPETGELGERNGAFVTNVEHKMGLKVSTTCELTFGQHGGVPAKAGSSVRFTTASPDVRCDRDGANAGGHQGYCHAVDRLPERPGVRQGARAGCRPDPDDRQDRAAGHHHPSPGRPSQPDDPEGLRRGTALAVHVHRDLPGRRSRRGAARVDAELSVKVNDLLLPIVKGVGSEQAYAKLTESLQTFGGSGFLQDYPVEQYIRDAKIDSLYEGTTAIQAQDFFFRKIVRDKGVALAHVAGQIEAFISSESGNGRLKSERELLAKALEDVQGMAASMTGYLMAAQDDAASIYKVGGLASVRFLMSVGDLVIGWLLQRQAAVAIAALDAGATGADASFYEGKIAVASFFAKNMLPLLTSTRQVIETIDNEIMELDEAAF